MTNHKEKHKQDTSESRHQALWGFIAGAKRRWVILSLAAIAVTALVLSLASIRTTSSTASNKSLSTFTVHRNDLTITVTESGSIKARNAIDIKSEVEGQATIISIVPEGTYITKEDVKDGKVLVELDSSNLMEQVAQKEIDFASAEASYAEAKEAYDIQLKQNESDITAAELKVKFGLMDFKKYLGETIAKKLIEGVNPAPSSNIDITSLVKHPQLGGESLRKWKELNDNITLAESKFERASDKLNWTQKLFEKKYVAETELKADELEVESLKIQKEKADIALELFKLYEFPKEAEKLLSDYNEAKLELERTHARARSKLAQASAKLKSAESRFRMRKGHLDKLKKQIGACVIKAPAPGLVVYSSSGDPWRRRERPIETGATVHERQKIMSLPDTTEMIAEIGVHESSVDKIRPGQTAKIVMDAFPDKTFQGKVLKVAPMPDSQRGWLNPDLKVYNTKVSIEGSFGFLKPGMSAKVEILVEQLDDVIIVPVQVVANRGGKKVCYCLTPQGPKEREVQTGSFNDTFVQIIDGLEAGEEVLLNPPRLTEARAEPKSKPKTKKQQKPPQSKEFELTDEVIERTMDYLSKIDPEKSKKLKQLQKSDPEKFKAELRKVILEQYKKFRQGQK